MTKGLSNEQIIRAAEAPGHPLRAIIGRSYTYMKRRDDGVGFEGAEGLVREAFALGLRAARAESEGTCPSDALDALDALERWYREDPPPAPASRDGQARTLPVRTARRLSGDDLRDAARRLSPQPAMEDYEDASRDGQGETRCKRCAQLFGPDEGTGGGR